MERRINRSQQGDLGEVSAIEWFVRAGAVVCTPLGYSPDYDLVVDFGEGPLRVQAKTSTQVIETPLGHERFKVMLATNGGNQSWDHETKLFAADRTDLVFVLVGNGRRWLIPAHEVEASRALQLGGSRYSEFEIDASGEIRSLVYTSASRSLSSYEFRGSVGAGEPSGTVNSVPRAEWVRIPPPPLSHRSRVAHGQTKISGSRQIVVPKKAFDAARLRQGDRLKAHAASDGCVVFVRVPRTNETGPPPGGPVQQSLEDDVSCD